MTFFGQKAENQWIPRLTVFRWNKLCLLWLLLIGACLLTFVVDIQQCNGWCHHVAYHVVFSMLKNKRLVLYHAYYRIIFPVDINKTPTFYQIGVWWRVLMRRSHMMTYSLKSILNQIPVVVRHTKDINTVLWMFPNRIRTRFRPL